MPQDNSPAVSPPIAGQGLAAALPWLTAELHRINLLHESGHRPVAIQQFHALASVAVQAQRGDLTGRGYIIRGRTADVSVFRIPAQQRPDKPIALFLPGLLNVFAADRRARSGFCRSV